MLGPKVGAPSVNQAGEVDGDASRGAVSLGSPSTGEYRHTPDRMRDGRPRTMREQRMPLPMPSHAGAQATEAAHEQLDSAPSASGRSLSAQP